MSESNFDYQKFNGRIKSAKRWEVFIILQFLACVIAGWFFVVSDFISTSITASSSYTSVYDPGNYYGTYTASSSTSSISYLQFAANKKVYMKSKSPNVSIDGYHSYMFMASSDINKRYTSVADSIYKTYDGLVVASDVDTSDYTDVYIFRVLSSSDLYFENGKSMFNKSSSATVTSSVTSESQTSSSRSSTSSTPSLAEALSFCGTYHSCTADEIDGYRASFTENGVYFEQKATHKSTSSQAFLSLTDIGYINITKSGVTDFYSWTYGTNSKFVLGQMQGEGDYHDYFDVPRSFSTEASSLAAVFSAASPTAYKQAAANDNETFSFSANFYTTDQVTLSNYIMKILWRIDGDKLASSTWGISFPSDLSSVSYCLDYKVTGSSTSHLAVTTFSNFNQVKLAAVDNYLSTL